MSVATERVNAGWGIGESLALLGVGAYAAVNALLRSVAADVDPFAGSLIRQLPLLVITTTTLIIVRPAAARPKHEDFVGPGAILLLMGAGVVSFLIGNVFLFQGFAWVGLAVAVAAMQGGMVVGGALVSWLFLKEPPRRSQIVGAGIVIIGLLLTAVPSWETAGGWQGIAGFVMSAAAGACYTVSNGASRKVQRGRKAFIVALASTNFGGVLALGIVTMLRAGGDITQLFAGATSSEILILFTAGLVNAVAIGSVTLAVRYTSVAAVSTISATVIVASTIIAGTVFKEHLPALLLIGSAVVLIGVIYGQLPPLSRLMRGARRAQQIEDLTVVPNSSKEK